MIEQPPITLIDETLFRHITPEEKEKSFVIADAQAADLPLVFVSPAFERQTGYSLRDVVGKNCRFLQGPDTDPRATKQIREALAKGEECEVFLLNYRKDGTPFWNHLKMRPLYETDNPERLSHFVATQTPVEQSVIERQFALA